MVRPQRTAQAPILPSVQLATRLCGCRTTLAHEERVRERVARHRDVAAHTVPHRARRAAPDRPRRAAAADQAVSSWQMGHIEFRCRCAAARLEPRSAYPLGPVGGYRRRTHRSAQRSTPTFCAKSDSKYACRTAPCGHRRSKTPHERPQRAEAEEVRPRALLRGRECAFVRACRCALRAAGCGGWRFAQGPRGVRCRARRGATAAQRHGAQ